MPNIPIANTELNSSFNTWRLNTNYISTVISNNVVTVSRAGDANRGGSITGDGHVEGTFSSTVFRTNTLKSGNTSVLGGSLLVASNTVFGGTGTDTHSLTVHANTTFNANVDFDTAGGSRVNLGNIDNVIISGGTRGQFLRLANEHDNPEFHSITMRDVTDLVLDHGVFVLAGGNTTGAHVGTLIDSPHLVFSGGSSNTDAVHLYLAGDATTGDSDLYRQFGRQRDQAADLLLYLYDRLGRIPRDPAERAATCAGYGARIRRSDRLPHDHAARAG